MKHIRIPITWTEGFGGDSLADAAGRVNLTHPRLVQLERGLNLCVGGDFTR